MDPSCAVCGKPPESSAGMNRVGGADVCDRCYHGGAPERIRERGWGFQIRQYERLKNREGERLYFSEASLTMPTDSPIQFTCRRKTLSWKLLGLVARGIETGDDIFDRHVRATSKTPKPARVILADEGVQSILLDMLGEGSWIRLRFGKIEVFSQRDEYVSDARFSSEMSVLASHIVRLQG